MVSLSPARTFLLGSFLVGLGGVGCGPPPEPEASEPSRELRIGLYSEPLSLDPHRHDEFLTFSVLNSVYEPLVTFDRELRLEPTLAASWENPTDLVWRFDLRPDVVFHDDRPLRAEDVVFSVRRALEHPESNLASYVVAVEDVRAVDELTVEIVTRRPYPILLNKLTHVLVVPRGAPDEVVSPVGTGPYRIVDRGPTLRLEAFEGYWGPPVSERAVALVPIPDRAERVERLLAGEIDLALDLSPGDLARVEAASGVHVEARDSLTVDYLLMRLDAPPFDDPRVRRAVHLAIDREGWVEHALEGQGAPAYQMVARSVFGFAPDLRPVQRDVAEARRLLTEAGYPDGIEVELEFRRSREGGDELRRQMAEAGIRVALAPRPWKDLFERLRANDVDFYHGAALASTGDSSDILDSKFHTPDVGWGETNFNRYSNPRVDRLIEASGTTLDMRRRRQALEQSMSLVMEDLPVVPLAVVFRLYGVRDDVRFDPRVDGRVLPKEIGRLDAARAPEPSPRASVAARSAL